VLYTDHKSLKHFLPQRVSSLDQQCWLAKLLGYQFKVKYKPGLENKAADALSRCHGDAEMNAMVSSPKWVEGKQLLQEVSQDVNIQKTITELSNNPDARPWFYVQQGVLFYKGVLVIASVLPLFLYYLRNFIVHLWGALWFP
jgi:hypothetical protein